MHRVLLVAVGAALVLGGCGGKKETKKEDKPDAAPVAKMPQAIVAMMADARLGSSENAFVNCFDATADQKKAVGAIYRLGKAMQQFREMFLDDYADQGALLAELPFGSFVADGQMILGAAEAQQLKAAKITQKDKDAKEATCPLPGSELTLKLVKKKDAWLVDASTFLPKVRPADKVAALLGKLAAELQTAGKRIGTEGVTPKTIVEDLKTKLEKAVAEAG